MGGNVRVQQTPDHALVLGLIPLRPGLEKIHAGFA
jgi:hypothetical protein